MPLTALRINYTHCDRHYRGAYFIPRVTESAKVSQGDADALYERYIAETLAKRAEFNAVKAHNNIFGTYITDSQTEVVETGWQNSERYLTDTAFPVTKWTFEYMLEVLPPMNWWGAGTRLESFQLMERMSGNITSTMMRVGDSYWHVFAPVGETPETTTQRLIARVTDLVEMNVGHAEHKAHYGKCSCCGAHIPKMRQWPNRDTTWGLCNLCIPTCSRAGADLITLMDGYGIPGYHFDTIPGL